MDAINVHSQIHYRGAAVHYQCLNFLKVSLILYLRTLLKSLVFLEWNGLESVHVNMFSVVLSRAYSFSLRAGLIGITSRFSDALSQNPALTLEYALLVFKFPALQLKLLTSPTPKPIESQV